MNNEKIGALIAQLRKEKGFTQQALAERLHLSNKTISKWECGQGCPDAGVWDELAEVLGVDMQKLMQGTLKPNKPDVGKMDKLCFYVCPSCGNIITATTKGEFSCCGRRLEPLVAVKAKEADKPLIEDLDNDYYVSFAHPMTKEHYLQFVSYVTDDRHLTVRLYPEQEAAVHLPVMRGRGMLYYYCTRHGLQKYPFKVR